jgi:probable F420-dependent oxidoreductase
MDHNRDMPRKQPAFPRLGVGLPTLGPHVSPEALCMVATAAERLGFHSVSVSERILLPAADGWRNVYGLPDFAMYDALETLTFVAARTQRIRLLTGTLNTLFQPPVVLARRLATLDQLSGGRLDVGIGQGWMPEEFVAAGVPLGRRGPGFEEHLAAMRACWGPDPVEFDGRHYRIPRSKVGPKPVNGQLPVYIGGVAQPAIERAARLGDGCILAFRDWESAYTQIDWYRKAGGTGPLVLCAGPMLADDQHLTPPTTFTEPAVLEDLARAAAAGVDEVHWDLNIIGLEPQRQVAAFEALAEALHAKTPA